MSNIYEVSKINSEISKLFGNFSRSMNGVNTFENTKSIINASRRILMTALSFSGRDENNMSLQMALL